MTSNISHSITTCLNTTQVHLHNWRSILMGHHLWESLTWCNTSPQSWYNTRLQSWYNTRSKYKHPTSIHENIDRTLYNTMSWLDTTQVPNLIQHKSRRMTLDVVQTTLPLSEGDILCFTTNFLPYQDYLRSISTLSLIEACPQICNLLINIYLLKYFLYMTMSSM